MDQLIEEFHDKRNRKINEEIDKLKQTIVFFEIEFLSMLLSHHEEEIKVNNGYHLEKFNILPYVYFHNHKQYQACLVICYEGCYGFSYRNPGEDMWLNYDEVDHNKVLTP